MQKISQEEYDKLVGLFRLQLNGIMNCFRCYGQDYDVDEASEEIEKLAIQFSMRIRGKDISLKVRDEPRRKPTE